MHMHIVLDDQLINEALQYSGAKNKREVVERALQEFVENHRQGNLLDLFGQGGIRPDYDYKKLRAGDE